MFTLGISSGNKHELYAMVTPYSKWCLDIAAMHVRKLLVVSWFLVKLAIVRSCGLWIPTFDGWEQEVGVALNAKVRKRAFIKFIFQVVQKQSLQQLISSYYEPMTNTTKSVTTRKVDFDHSTGNWWCFSGIASDMRQGATAPPTSVVSANLCSKTSESYICCVHFRFFNAKNAFVVVTPF